jgi:hypothetical protein
MKKIRKTKSQIIVALRLNAHKEYKQFLFKNLWKSQVISCSVWQYMYYLINVKFFLTWKDKAHEFDDETGKDTHWNWYYFW